jgi:hypothetical protein
VEKHRGEDPKAVLSGSDFDRGEDPKVATSGSDFDRLYETVYRIFGFNEELHIDEKTLESKVDGELKEFRSFNLRQYQI